MEINYLEDLLLAKISTVVDEETGKELRLDFTYANDETGEYRYRDKHGLEVTRWGQIKIKERPLVENRNAVDKKKAIQMIKKKLRTMRRDKC